MPAFRYEPHVDRYAGSIADLLLQRGVIGARQAEAIGAARAQGALAQGQASAGMANAIGGAVQQVAAIPGQIQQQQRVALQDEATGLELEDRRRANRSRLIFEAELKNPGNYKPDGTVDDAKVAARLMKQDIGAATQWTTLAQATEQHRLNLSKTALEIKNSTATAEEKQRAIGLAQADYLGNLAWQTERVLDEKPNDPLHARDTFLAGVAHAAASGAIGESDARDVLMKTAVAGQTELRQAISALVTPEARTKGEAAASKLAHEAAQTAELEAKTKGTIPANPAQAETARHNLEMERIGRLTAGRGEASAAETARHNRAMEDAARNTKTSRPVLSGDANRLADIATSLDQAEQIAKSVTDPGTLARVQSWAPSFVTEFTGGWGEGAKAQNALIALVRQIVGKGLEGGVLRKEDEQKYKDILPRIGDTKELITDKLANLTHTLEAKRANTLDALQDSGYEVSKFRTRQQTADASALQDRAKAVLQGAGKVSDDAAVAVFLKNNPTFK